MNYSRERKKSFSLAIVRKHKCESGRDFPAISKTMYIVLYQVSILDVYKILKYPNSESLRENSKIIGNQIPK